LKKSQKFTGRSDGHLFGRISHPPFSFFSSHITSSHPPTSSGFIRTPDLRVKNIKVFAYFWSMRSVRKMPSKKGAGDVEEMWMMNGVKWSKKPLSLLEQQGLYGGMNGQLDN
jgi:hypothetical protein